MSRYGAALVAAAAALAVAMPAQAAERLEAYKVKPKSPRQVERLAQAGFDVTEGGRGRSIEIVATRSEARKLRKSGLRARLVRDRRGRRTATAVAAQAAAGWKVWRPYARTDVEVSPDAGNPTDNLMTQLEDLAAEHPDIAQLQTIGHSLRGLPIYAMKVTRDAAATPDGSRPAVLYSSLQHAREWLAGETGRRTLRLFLDNYGRTGTAIGTDGEPVAGVDSAELTRLVDTRELWFVLVANPDGYDFTFTPANRLWRKNLRDNNGDGQITAGDGVDLNRNFPTHWGYDNEGSLDDPADETYRGTAPASEPETRALDGLMARVPFIWNKNDHTHGRLLLYPLGWQVDTHAADEPIFRTIAGDDDDPAIPTFDPDLGAELYTTNGDTNDHAYGNYGTISFTPEGTPAASGSGFVFQDVEADVQAEFERHVQFALDLARSDDPSRPVSHLGNEVPDFEVDSFAVSHGDPQTVQVTARRDLGPVLMKYSVNGANAKNQPTKEWDGGERYGDEGDYWYRRMRAAVQGTRPGDEVRVWFTAPRTGARSESFTYTVESDSERPVLIVAAEDYTGISNLPEDPAQTAPKYLSYYEQALQDNGIAYDVWDVDARGRTRPDPLGVLSHYDAVIWYTGNDFFTREPGIGGGRASRIAHTIQMAMRDYLNEGGTLLYAGKYAGRQYNNAEYPEEGRSPALCDGNINTSNDRCQPLSNDFQQYYLGAYTRTQGGGLVPGATLHNTLPLGGVDDPLRGLTWTLEGEDSARNQDDVPPPNRVSTADFLVTSNVLPAERYPAFARSWDAADWVKPGGAPFDPHDGSRYAHSQAASTAFKRLTRTIDLSQADAASLSFWTSFQTEANWDYVMVEAHEVGQDDWTTLADRNGNTSRATGSSCTGTFGGQTFQQLHPQLNHYQTRLTGPTRCLNTGTTGEWHAATGNSGGWEQWDVDLSRWAGKQVEVSITYVTDWFTLGLLNVLVDEARVTRDGAVELESFESGLGAWRADSAPGSPQPPNNWIDTTQVLDDAAVVATEDSLFFGFGLEGVTGRDTRRDLMGRAMAHLLG